MQCGHGAGHALDCLTQLASRLTPADRQRLRSSVLTESLSAFVKASWGVLEPGAVLRWGWHLDAICEHLEAVAQGQIRKLLINIPPRSLKTTIVSICFPAWEWLRDPTKRFLTGSYRLDLSREHARKARDLIRSTFYQELVSGAWKLKDDQDVKSRYENTRTGLRVCTAQDAGATGEGGNFIIIDDPHNVQDVGSELELAESRRWLDQAISTRLNNPKHDCRVMVMQRVHEGDLSAHVLKQGWEHLMLPTEYEPDHPHRSKTSLNFKDPRTLPGELLCEAHFGKAEVAEAQISLNPFGYAGQHQQRPSPEKGALFKRDDFRYWDVEPEDFDLTLFSWDFAFKGAEQNRGTAAQIKAITDPSYVVGDLWGFKGNNCYLLDQVRGQWDYARSKLEFIAFSERYSNVLKKLVEAKANGPAIESELQGSIGGIELVEPKGGKYQRAIAMQPRQASGYIHIPHPRHYPWVEEWLTEVCAFPLAKKNDRVDTMSQAVNYVFRGTESPLDRIQHLLKLADVARGDV